MTNHLLGEMEAVFGLGPISPRIQIPMPTYIASAPVTMKTVNNIRLESGSQVGQINAGAIVYLDRVVTEFKAGGANELACELQSLTQAVVDSQELNADAQRQILDLLRFVLEEVHKPKQNRNSSVISIALQTISTLTAAAKAILLHWDKVRQVLESILR